MISKNLRAYPPALSVVGASGVGKTTLLERLIPALVERFLRVGTIKHDVHGFEMDREGKDSWRHKRAGARVTLISSPFQIGMVRDVGHDHSIDELLSFMEDVDLILTEGYKREDKPKLEVFRPEIRSALICQGDPNLIAVVTDTPMDLHVPRFSFGDVAGLADFLVSYFALAPLTDAGVLSKG